MEANLLHTIHNIRPSESQVLKCTSKTTVMSSIRNKSTIRRKLSISINRSVVKGLQLIIPACSRMSVIYWRWEKKRPPSS
jgi:hypothetical protein